MSMSEILISIQNTSAVHYKYVKELEELFTKMGANKFFQDFNKNLMIAFNKDLKLKNPFMDRYFDFCVLFTETLETREIIDASLFVINVFESILNCFNVQEVNLRYHACLFIYKYIQHLIKSDKTINDNLYEKITQAILEKLEDNNSQIRILCVNIIKLLQNFENDEDTFSTALIKNLNDTNSKVRAAIIDALNPSINNLPFLIDRCRDIDELVRMAVYKKVSNIPVQIFTIKQRHFLLRNGLRDRKERVKNCLNTTVLPTWLNNYELDYNNFLKGLQLDSNKKEIEDTKLISNLVLESLFKNRPVEEILEVLILENKLIPLHQLTWQSALFWNALISYLKTTNLEEYWDLILPETVHFCNYIDKFYTTSQLLNGSIWEQQHFLLILHELICIAIGCDITDEASRKKLNALLLNCLKDRKLLEETIHNIIKFFEISMPNPDRRIIFFCELISDIRAPLDSKFSQLQIDEDEKTIKILNAKIRRLILEKNDAVEKGNYQQAKQLKQEILLTENMLEDINNKLATKANEEQIQQEKNNDPEIVTKCLNIIYALLQSPQVKVINTALKSLKDEIFLELAMCQDSVIREKYFKCYGIICSLDKNAAQENIHFFCLPLILYKSTKSEDESILISAVNCVGDLLLIYGANILPIDENSLDMFSEHEVTTLNEIINILCLMLDDESLQIGENACEVLIKLMITRKIESPDIFARLFIKWINPACADHTRYIQLIGVFIETFCQLPNVESQLEQAIIPILQTIGQAPPTNALSHISNDVLLKTIIKIFNLRQDEDYPIHENAAIKICMEIQKNYNDICVNLFIKALLYLELNRDNEDIIENLLNMSEDILIELRDKTVKKNMEKFIHSLKYD